jgi:CBS domain-containing protein
MSVGKICTRTVYTADREESTLAAAHRMKGKNVGTLVVLDEDKKPVGILTDRDLVERVLALGLQPDATRVGDVMSGHPRCVDEGAPIEDALVTMRGLGVRRMPVVDPGGRLAGMVSVDDVLQLLTEELGQIGRIVGLSHAGSGLPAKTSRSIRVPSTAPRPS